MKYVAYGVLILLTLVLQTAGVPGIVFFGFKPELMLMLTLLAGMIMPPAEAAVFGFFAGLAQDLIVGRFLTLHAGVFVLMALAEGFVARRFYRENILVRFSSLLLGTAMGEVLYLLGAASFGLSRPWTLGTWTGILAVSVVNGFLGALVYRPLVRLNKRLVYYDELLKRTG
ncbi:MAG: rod shape-determining protein MreD [Limnochordia bacterium]|jgi:rod shape-determining protein MreD|nr:rod shape-determining protein MreD [Bacillota bacterium]NLL07462.1 rod shape-determining protein MreD [Bacillota bacterium]HBG10446.1 rod shape-determining protein MreD [Bacillota bacterium]